MNVLMERQKDRTWGLQSLLVVVIDWLAGGRCHHHRLASLSLHLLIDLTEHLITHHVHHRVGELLLLLHHWRLLHHHLGLEHVDVLWVLQVIDQVVQLHLGKTLLLDKVLTLIQIKAHVVSLLEEGLLLLEEVLWDHTSLLTLGPHGQLLLNQTPLLFSPGVRVDTLLSHPVEELAWNLVQCLLR